MKSNTTMTLPTSTDRTTFEITKDLEKVAYMSMADGSWIANPGKRDEVNTLLYEMNLAQKQQNLQNEGEITKGEKWASATAGSVFEGLQDWDTGVKIAMHKVFGQDVPEYLLTDSVIATDNQRRLEDAGWGMKLLSDISKATGNMLPTMTIGLVFPQAEIKALGKFAKLVKKTATSTSVFTSSFGNTYKQAIREGRPEDEAVSYALLNATSETALQQLLGIVGGNKGIKWLGNKVAGSKIATHIDDVISVVAKNPAVKKKLYDYASAFGGEFVEEFLQSVMQPVFENIAYSGEDYTFKNNPVTVTWDDVYDGLVGGITGSVFESVGMVPKDSAIDMDTDIQSRPQTNAKTDTDADIQTKTDTNTKPSVKVKSTSDGKGTSLFDKATQKNLEKLSESDAIAADEAATEAYAEHLKGEGVDPSVTDNFVKQSAMSRTSKASAIEHTLKVISEYGAAIRNRIKKINASNIDTTQTTKPVDANIKLQNKTAFSETELKSMDTPQLQNIVQTLSNDFAKSWKAAGLDPVTVDQQVSEMTRQSDAAELIKSAQIMQKELGFGEDLMMSKQSDSDVSLQKGKLISKENYNDFVSQMQQLHVKTEGFETYHGDVEVLQQIVEDIQFIKQQFPTLNNIKNGLLLKYENLNDIKTYAKTAGKTITLNKEIFDDIDYLKRDYKSEANDGFFVKGTDYRSIIYHEIGHVLNKQNPKLLGDMQKIIQQKAETAGMKTDEYIEKNISKYAKKLDHQLRFTELLPEALSACYNCNIQTTTDLMKEILTELGFEVLK